MLAMEMIGTAFVLVMVMMSLLWLFYFFRRNASAVDLGWSLGFLIVAVVYGLMGDGDFWRKWIFTLMAFLWSGRLSWYLLRRFSSEHEDPRYKELLANLQGNLTLKVYFMFLFQGLLVILLSVPFLLVSLSQNSGLGTYELIGILIWALALWGETVSDNQLATFKKYPGNAERVCQEGWWYYSRHPNYFFEWMIWVGYFIFSLSIPYGFLMIYCPLLMLYLLLKVSGIPLTEELAVRRKGEAYRQYQQSTSAFVPWFKK
jgi:steroid 5-alpha reductase family enzyme